MCSTACIDRNGNTTGTKHIENDHDSSSTSSTSSSSSSTSQQHQHKHKHKQITHELYHGLYVRLYITFVAPATMIVER